MGAVTLLADEDDVMVARETDYGGLAVVELVFEDHVGQGGITSGEVSLGAGSVWVVGDAVSSGLS
ncbi:hypothetical protein HNQ07_004164 [Deinococcus metalli]|uniref:Uncharacterized protein n=1 Tax=Deinococcus metalli TaxID=1141878 RepID=A0A7W8KI84_9DEIO|nr:hypothetical protein [Deinococcus metalli]MBB5378657.1 hypothetical protein [Deinococcus metalli]GHF61470.1 hypothetical protein GCM10017781_42050 [Deinococcus metalli]